MRAMESLFQMIKKGWNSQFLLTDASLLMQQQSQHPQDLQQQVLGYKIPPEHCPCYISSSRQSTTNTFYLSETSKDTDKMNSQQLHHFRTTFIFGKAPPGPPSHLPQD